MSCTFCFSRRLPDYFPRTPGFLYQAYLLQSRLSAPFTLVPPSVPSGNPEAPGGVDFNGLILTAGQLSAYCSGSSSLRSLLSVQTLSEVYSVQCDRADSGPSSIVPTPQGGLTAALR